MYAEVMHEGMKLHDSVNTDSEVSTVLESFHQSDLFCYRQMLFVLAYTFVNNYVIHIFITGW